VRERLVPLIAPAERVSGVDHELAVKSADIRECVGDCAGGHGHEDRVGIGRITAFSTEPRDDVAGALPPPCEPAADVPPPDDCDVHGVSVRISG
jgi:hypothetical protein